MSTIQQYMAWAEQRIARLVIHEGLHVGLLKGTQGPLTVTFHVRLLVPSRAAVSKLLKLGDAIAEAVQVEAVRITRSAGAFAIELPSPLQRTPSSAELSKHAKGIQVCVGLDNLRQPVYVDLRQHGALLWVGPSRRGKTQSMKCTLHCLVQQSRRFKFIILCHERKREDWQAFAAAAGCMGIVTSPVEHRQALWWASTILLKMRTPFTFAIVIDDLLNLLEEAPEIAPHLAKLSSLGAGLGVHLLVGTQEAGSKRGTGGEGVEANASAKILYKATSKARAARNAGQGELDLAALTGAKGDAVLLVDGMTTRIATGYADDRDILQLTTGPQYQAPWREATSSTEDHPTQEIGSMRTSTATSSVLDATSGTRDVLAPYPPSDEAFVGVVADALAPHSTNGMAGTQNSNSEHKLTDSQPDTVGRAYLRTLYEQYRSKNQVLKVAWGGVVNQDGKTPKTWRWLQEALAEERVDEDNGTSPRAEQSVVMPVGKTYPPEGASHYYLAKGIRLLPRDEDNGNCSVACKGE